MNHKRGQAISKAQFQDTKYQNCCLNNSYILGEMTIINSSLSIGLELNIYGAR
jgi:hypothetical protein